MCGIIGVISRPSTRPTPTAASILRVLDEVVADLEEPETVGSTDAEGLLTRLESISRRVGEAERLLRGVPGLDALVTLPDLVPAITARLDQLDAWVVHVDAAVEAAALGPEAVEAISTAIGAVRDRSWSVRRDRLRAVTEVLSLAGPGAPKSSLGGYLALHQALSALDRLEVRGRDSAGLHVFVSAADLGPAIATSLDRRRDDELFRSGAVRWSNGTFSFVYKAAAEIGELGDNTRALRREITADQLLRQVLSEPGAQVAVLGHTRWASVGIISEPNTHPLNSDELDDTERPYVIAALNGDVDNHADLRVEHGLHLPPPITTDAKVIPVIYSRHLALGIDADEAFRRTVVAFEGSVAIAAASADQPGQLRLALRGSGQGLFVGLAEDRFIVASEPYGVVEEADHYLRMDGEHGGELIALDAARAGELSGVTRIGYDGSRRPVDIAEVVLAEVTTRDIDRGDAPHFLMKEIEESPESFRRTLRGKIVEIDGRLRPSLGTGTLPAEIVARLAERSITRIRVIGQGTAAVAGQSVAALLEDLCDGSLDVRALTATELSGFQLRMDMSDTLAIAVSQSGTTTDTNRTVDLLRARGAAVIAIVNRRGSDLVDKSDGVLYTSDGRDVEMSVASTKAFYAQVAAGALLACVISEVAGCGDARRRDALLAQLREMPEAMRAVLADRDRIAEVARRFAPSKRYWAVVGNGPNRVAAEEVRIKLSELCYKSIACDATEDKKHIDLSSEPLILVCAAGLHGSTADDVAKETAIFRAHKATPIVIADRGDARYSSVATLEVPPVDPALGFVLSAMVGHIFGYEAALAIDATARPLRESREAVERAVGTHERADAVLETVIAELRPQMAQFAELLGRGDFDGQLEARTAVGLAELFRDLGAERPVEEYHRRTGRIATPAALIDDLVAALTRAIEELTRPVDAIKHQAKTVTVGISRSDEGILDRALVRAILDAGAGRDRLSYRTVKVLADLDPAVAEVTGYTRYAVHAGRIEIIDRGGIARDLPSRVERSSELVGTKRRVADEREVLVARGRTDGRTVIFVPEVKAGACTGITLLHVRFHDRIDPATMRSVLQGYDRRYDRLVDWVTETEGAFDDARLGTLPVADLLIRPISETADLWRS